jgi:hypothetical protein
MGSPDEVLTLKSENVTCFGAEMGIDARLQPSRSEVKGIRAVARAAAE